jgi:hypothetical protein
VQNHFAKKKEKKSSETGALEGAPLIFVFVRNREKVSENRFA